MNWKEPISIINCNYKCYLIGSMEDTSKKDGGILWRQTLTPELNARGVYCFDPTREEIKKVGITTSELLEKLTGWELSGNWKLFLKYMDKIWRDNSYIAQDSETKEPTEVRVMGDIDYITHSDFLIWHHEEGDNPGGTIAELAIAWYRGIPVYLFTDMPVSKINKSLLYFVLSSGYNQGGIFKSQNKLLEFLDNKYKFNDLKKEGEK